MTYRLTAVGVLANQAFAGTMGLIMLSKDWVWVGR